MRRAAVTGILVGFCVVLAGCSSDAGDEPTTSPSASPSQAREVLIWADALHAPALEQAGQEYGTRTGVTVKVQNVDLDNIDDRVAELAPQGQGPDLFLGASSWVGELADGGLIVPVDLGTAKERFTPVAVAGMTLDGQIYGVPIETENLALIRNTDLAPKAPASIEEMSQLGLALEEKGAVSLPIALPVGRYGDAYHWHPFYSAAGGFIFGQRPDGSYEQDDLGVGKPGSVEAAKLLATLTEDGALDADVESADALEAFTEGRAAFLIGGPWSIDAIRQAGIPFVVEAIPNSSQAAVARSQALVSTAGLMASAFARNLADAQDFLSSSVMTTTFMDASFAQSGAAPAWSESFDKAAADPVVKAFGDYARASVPIPNLAVMTEVWPILSQAQLDVMKGEDAKDTMEQAGSDIEDAIDAG